MFQVPFEHILDPVIFDELAEAGERRTTKEYRVFPVSQNRLLNGGAEDRSDDGGTSGPLIKVAKYIGNKWGGKYLRAPDIYWTILDKGKDKLERLGDFAVVRYGIKTGANGFFYLDTETIERWGIEDEYLRPVIKSPKECKTIRVGQEALKNRLFVCLEDKRSLRGTAALEYIERGESTGYDGNASVRGRRCWWHTPRVTGTGIFVKEANDASAVFYNPERLPIDCRLYCADLPTITLLFLNSPIAAMMFEIYNRAGLGEGARSLMVSDYASVPCLHESTTSDDLDSILEGVGSLRPRDLSPAGNEDWTDLDSLIFDSLMLTLDERDAVYEAAIRLVEARLKKAGSV